MSDTLDGMLDALHSFDLVVSEEEWKRARGIKYARIDGRWQEVPYRDPRGRKIGSIDVDGFGLQRQCALVLIESELKRRGFGRIARANRIILELLAKHAIAVIETKWPETRGKIKMHTLIGGESEKSEKVRTKLYAKRSPIIAEVIQREGLDRMYSARL